jgi:hypothetical protein
LDDKTPLYKDAGFAVSAYGRSLPSRACDAALEAMLTILDGSPDKAYTNPILN